MQQATVEAWKAVEEELVAMSAWEPENVRASLNEIRSRGYSPQWARRFLLPAARIASDFDHSMREVQDIMAKSPEEIQQDVDRLRSLYEQSILGARDRAAKQLKASAEAFRQAITDTAASVKRSLDHLFKR